MASEQKAPRERKRKRTSSQLSNGTEVNESLKEEQFSSWSEENVKILLNRIDDFATRSGHTVTGRRRNVYPKHINWEEIKFDRFTAASCKEAWSKLSFRVRRQRTLKEILDETRESLDTRKLFDVGEKPVNLKKPMTAFFLYMNAKRPGAAKKHPDLTVHEIAMRLSDKWKKLPEEKKQKYQKRYEKNKAEFDANLTAHFIETYPELSPPKSAFDLWSIEEKKKILQEKGEISDKKLRKKLKRRWENQDDSVIQIWEEKSKMDAKKFRAKAAKHEKLKTQK